MGRMGVKRLVREEAWLMDGELASPTLKRLGCPGSHGSNFGDGGTVGMHASKEKAPLDRYGDLVIQSSQPLSSCLQTIRTNPYSLPRTFESYTTFFGGAIDSCCGLGTPHRKPQRITTRITPLQTMMCQASITDHLKGRQRELYPNFIHPLLHRIHRRRSSAETKC